MVSGSLLVAHGGCRGGGPRLRATTVVVAVAWQVQVGAVVLLRSMRCCPGAPLVSSWRRGLVRGSFWAAMEVFILVVIFGFLSPWRLPGFALVASATISRTVVMIRTATFVAATGSLGVAAGGMR